VAPEKQTSMFTVAIIGADGAGKTTIASRLLETFPMPMKYIYMGMNAQSSNVALPTSRLIFFLKTRKLKKAQIRAGKPQPEVVSLHSIEHRRDKRGKIGAAARLLNRLAEESYRQCVSWYYYQLRNYIVLYDRHFLFDFSWNPRPDERFTNRIHFWFLNHVYPKPDLVIFLDAPPEVLYARKQEVPLDYLRKRREAFMEKGKTMPNFNQIDASQPLDQVYAEVAQQIMQFEAAKRGRTFRKEAETI